MSTGLVTKVTLGNTFCSWRKRPIDPDFGTAMPTGLVTKFTLGNTFCSLHKRPIDPDFGTASSISFPFNSCKRLQGCNQHSHFQRKT